ncbi:bifunctional [glutamine synthetase] adenylyltransferase/[glutamine synthetase]-adenylyl-L-tyrosine phosphorylase [Terrihabitans sp. B22-R8]|uniref:bifunctional [glutamine synthetase] adenylyltransferase/[glutamine synthetase]-adenylyl-L-tyrosine phosphorylase n=1 Tax=Terrihabitans sp. B22-R8 TaxID=3425128 RepID=UPI00403C41C6
MSAFPLSHCLRRGPRPGDDGRRKIADLLADHPPLVEECAARPDVEDVLAGIAEGSSFLWRLMSSDPARLLNLLKEPAEQSRERVLADVRAAADENDEAVLMRRLRRGKQEMALLLALADLGGVWGVPEVTAALSDLADQALSAALRFLLRKEVVKGTFKTDADDPERDSGLILLAMGKHGARELNYSSDIDLIVLFDREAAPLAEGLEPAPFFVRVVQRLVRIMQERTADGYVFRTDLRLRPDPGSTAIAISVGAALSYYESVGQNWERAAMLKARPCAGDIAAGEAFLKELTPFVWRRYLDYAAIADIHAMKRQIHAHRGHGVIAVEGHNLKLGRGGIREIEFFVQTQQLVAGGRNPALRVRSTEEALSVLVREGWIDAGVQGDLVTAYRFLRGLEHRLQMVADEQTHSLPEDAGQIERFARFAGFDGRDAFADALQEQLQIVQGHYEHLFEDAPPLDVSLGSLVFTGDHDDPETLATLQKMGFSDPAQVSELVRGWHHGRTPATRSARARELLTELVPALLQAFGQTSDPNLALRAFDRLLGGLRGGIEFFAILRSNAGFLGLIADALGTAPRLAEIVSKRPHVLDAVFEPAFFARLPTREEMAERLDHSLAEAVIYEDVLDRARIFGQEQRVLIGMRVLSGTIGADRAGAAYARLADLLIERLHAEALKQIETAHGRIPGGCASALALGKLGGREMTAASDLDVIVIYDHPDEATESDGPRPLAPSQYYARLTQRLIAALSVPTSEGALYEVDLRLRPSGRAGPLATRLSAFRSYQANEAWIWEHMAVTRARPISGEEDFQGEILNAIFEVLERPREPATIAAEVRSMRATLEKEKGSGNPWDIKYAVGGLIDLEFIAQYLQLAHGNQHREILHTSTALVLDEARNAGLIAEGDWEVLRGATDLQHNLTQVLRLCLSAPFDPATASTGLKNLLARSGNMPDFPALDAELRHRQEQVREIFNRLVPG